jgi:hypothetical protein
MRGLGDKFDFKETSALEMMMLQLLRRLEQRLSYLLTSQSMVAPPAPSMALAVQQGSCSPEQRSLKIISEKTDVIDIGVINNLGFVPRLMHRIVS